MVLIQPLDLEYWFVNVLSGTPLILIGIMTILIAGMAAKFRMNTLTFGMIIGLFAILVASIANWMLFLAVLVVGLLVFFSIGRLVRT